MAKSITRLIMSYAESLEQNLKHHIIYEWVDGEVNDFYYYYGRFPRFRTFFTREAKEEFFRIKYAAIWTDRDNRPLIASSSSDNSLSDGVTVSKGKIILIPLIYVLGKIFLLM